MQAQFDWAEIQTCIEAHSALRVQPVGPVSGGCIHSAWRVAGPTGPLFLKLNGVDQADVFAAEADGLEALAVNGAVRVPHILCAGQTARTAFLLLEWVDMAAPDEACQRKLGEQLAVLHRQKGEAFGWRRDNYIGSTRQPNDRLPGWEDFLRNHRLGFQLQLASARGHGGSLQDKGERLLALLGAFFSAYTPQPCLLHGDLWAGNYAAAGGLPVLFDPAVYYGDRESDLAMTELFGGFGNEFYAAYGHSWPLDAGYAVRRDLYQLYHLLNHLNLFGEAYRQQALAAMERLLAEAGG